MNFLINSIDFVLSNQILVISIILFIVAIILIINYSCSTNKYYGIVIGIFSYIILVYKINIYKNTNIQLTKDNLKLKAENLNYITI